MPIDFCSMEKNTMEANGDEKLFGYQHSLKYPILCSAEDETHTGLNNLRLSELSL